MNCGRWCWAAFVLLVMTFALTRALGARTTAESRAIVQWENLPSASTLASSGVVVPQGQREQSQTVEDCDPYDVRKLSILSQGERGWLVTDGGKFSFQMNSRTDAESLIAVASHYLEVCYVGRLHKATTAGLQIQYWKGERIGGPVSAMPDAEDCVSYDPNLVKIVRIPVGYQINEGGSRPMMTLLEEGDAAVLLAVVKSHTQRCFIGRRDNHRDRPGEYIVTYWK